ncbi:MAG: hypothetical protein AAGE52_04970 [Myxococcota bacterium]
MSRVCSLAVLVFVSCAPGEVAPASESLTVVFVPPDPGQETQYECIRTLTPSHSDAIYGPTTARVTYPVQDTALGCSFSAIGGEVVLLLPGAGFVPADYTHLSEHLARNGFLVVAVDATEASPSQHCGPSSACAEDRAERGVRFLRWWRDTTPWSDRFDFDHVAVIGHSRGGEAAAFAASYVRSEIGGGAVDAVVALAPSDSSLPAIELSRSDARSVLVMYGSRDEDVLSQSPAPMANPAPTGFLLYDRTGSEYGIESPWALSLGDRIERAFAFVHEADHAQFSDRCHTFACVNSTHPDGVLDCEAQQAVTRSFVTAWLRLQVRGESPYRVFFNDTIENPFMLPLGSSGPHVLSYGLYDDGRVYGRMVEDNFEDAELSTGTAGSAVTTFGVSAEVRATPETAGTFPHGPQGRHFLRVTDIGDAGDRIEWEFPRAFRGAPPRRGIEEFHTLSLRAGREFESAEPWTIHPPRLRVQLRLAGGATSPQIALHTLPDPDGHDVYATLCGQILPYGVSPLRTLRVPLNEFGVDLADVRGVIVYLDVNELAGEAVYLDDLRFEGAPEQVPFSRAACANVAPPEPPSRVFPPRVNPRVGICGASSGPELLARVADETCAQVVLSAGDFDLAGPLRIDRPVDLIGQGASTVLHFGIEFRPPLGSGADATEGASGSSLRGARFVINNPALVPQAPVTGLPNTTYVLGFWEQAGAVEGLRDITLEDIAIDGRYTVDQGVLGTAPRGAQLRRISVGRVRRFGINLRNARPIPVPAHDAAYLSDLTIAGVQDDSCLDAEWDPSCGATGSHQAGLWVGASHTRAVRVRVRDVYWTGVATGRLEGVSNVSLRDIDVDRIGLEDAAEEAGVGAGTGVYIEKISTDFSLGQFCIGPETERGVNVEWDLCVSGNGAVRPHIFTGRIESEYMGVGLDWGTTDAIVEDIRVANPRWSAFVFHNNCDHPGQVLDGSCSAPTSCTSAATTTTTWQNLWVDAPDVCPPGVHPGSAACTCALSFTPYDPDSGSAKTCAYP